MKTIKASEFKVKCLRLMDEVAESGDPLVITRYGRPVSQLVPYRRQPDSLFGLLAGSVEIHGDVVGPIDVEWAAAR